ncbi:VOC family protein [Isoptericola sp. NPDC058082]|uniref:VOC family protein n=1 Tax=Isoptericola sp. NPDC058082 TaxID=3346331 RepID=UPI0036E284E4
MEPDRIAPPGRGGATPATVVPYLAVRGASEAIDYYRRAFGAQERFRIEEGGVVAHLVDGGARLERGVDDGPQEGWRSAWVVDPYGHRWHVSSPTAG